MNDIKAPDIDLNLVREFEYRKRKIQLIEDGRKAYETIYNQLQTEQSIDAIRAVALNYARDFIEGAIASVDHAINALTFERQYRKAVGVVNFLFILLILSNFLTAALVWLILH